MNEVSDQALKYKKKAFREEKCVLESSPFRGLKDGAKLCYT